MKSSGSGSHSLTRFGEQACEVVLTLSSTAESSQASSENALCLNALRIKKTKSAPPVGVDSANAPSEENQGTHVGDAHSQPSRSRRSSGRSASQTTSFHRAQAQEQLDLEEAIRKSLEQQPEPNQQQTCIVEEKRLLTEAEHQPEVLLGGVEASQPSEDCLPKDNTPACVHSASKTALEVDASEPAESIVRDRIANMSGDSGAEFDTGGLATRRPRRAAAKVAAKRKTRQDSSSGSEPPSDDGSASDAGSGKVDKDDDTASQPDSFSPSGSDESSDGDASFGSASGGESKPGKAKGKGRAAASKGAPGKSAMAKKRAPVKSKAAESAPAAKRGRTTNSEGAKNGSSGSPASAGKPQGSLGKGKPKLGLGRGVVRPCLPASSGSGVKSMSGTSPAGPPRIRAGLSKSALIKPLL
ncbi:hypothetical protein FVE85_2956 [Porphyridium purpureum]|uniref:RAD51 interacting motif domain-containing protein n=1 Tax=Porphyridium purpureum TaxID=35688 RepID=A0A5J4YU01_PORPP|nr:hypothetical protein FVE85_2956 [Porphyridium purpureum]|eukprot:POR0487..scf227_4